MKREKPRPCGLLIRLEKDVLGVPHTNSGNDFVLGYFDRVIFDHVDRWLDFSPRKSSTSQNGKLNKTDNPLSIYPIKLLFPARQMISRLEALGFDYHSWMGNLSHLLSSNPCITIALINLTDQFKTKADGDICGKQLKQLADVIYNGQYYNEDNTAQKLNFAEAGGAAAHVCLLPSLGYSDYCLLIAEKNWTFAPSLFEYLHRARSGRKIVLSTDYVMPVYHVPSNHSEELGKPVLSNSQISIHIHLRPGISMGQLVQYVGNVADVWQVSGSSDCVLVSKEGKSVEDLFCAFSLGLEGMRGNTFQNLVISTESKLQRRVTALPQTKNSLPASEESSEITRLRGILLQYRALLSENNRHMRLFNATWERVTLVESICGQAHNGELRTIMDRWISTVTYCLEQEIEELQNWLQTWKEDPTPLSEAEQKLRWSEIETALNTFVTQVGSFLADLSRSDSFSMESERYNHASVGSATKLLLAYNRWQNQFVVDVQKEVGDDSEYVFLVRSGGCDSTHTDSVFSAVDPQLETRDNRQIMFERKPLITHMSEMALFDCGGAIFRMTHECMHYCGERKRKERVQALITFISRYYGLLLSQALLGRSEFFNVLCSQLKSLFNLECRNLTAELEKCWKSSSVSLRDKIAQHISLQLNQQYENDRINWDERNYMGTELYAWLQKTLSEMFLCYSLTSGRYPSSDIVEVLYHFVLETVIDYYKSCDEAIHRYDRENSLIFCAIERRKAEKTLFEFQNSGIVKDSALWNQVNFILTRLLSDPVLPSRENDSFAYLQNHTVSKVLDFIFDCFSETFADTAACVRLGASLPDYILAFVFESWDLNEALPLDRDHVYRIPSVLHLCYPEALQKTDGKIVLSAAAKQNLDNAIQRLVIHGMPTHRIASKLLYSRIEQLLNSYQENSPWIAQPLADYLRKCKKQHERDAKKHAYMKRYSVAFHKIRLLDDDAHPDLDAAYADKVVKMLTNLITIGKKDGDV